MKILDLGCEMYMQCTYKFSTSVNAWITKLDNKSDKSEEAEGDSNGRT